VTSFLLEPVYMTCFSTTLARLREDPRISVRLGDNITGECAEGVCQLRPNQSGAQPLVCCICSDCLPPVPASAPAPFLPLPQPLPPPSHNPTATLFPLPHPLQVTARTPRTVVPGSTYPTSPTRTRMAWSMCG
jgi:hypothetical protein